jgi:hypothetical protein
LVAGICAVGISLAPIAARAECYTAAEWPAFNVKVMQEFLQDAALQCKSVVGHNHDADYNDFIQRSSEGVKRNGEVFRAHFKRVYRGAWQDKMDRFATRIENVAQSRSMSSMSYCADSDALFAEARQVSSANIETVAIAFNQAHFRDLAELGEVCTTKKAKTQKASTKTHHHKQKKVAKTE